MIGLGRVGMTVRGLVRRVNKWRYIGRRRVMVMRLSQKYGG